MEVTEGQSVVRDRSPSSSSYYFSSFSSSSSSVFPLPVQVHRDMVEGNGSRGNGWTAMLPQDPKLAVLIVTIIILILIAIFELVTWINLSLKTHISSFISSYLISPYLTSLHFNSLQFSLGNAEYQNFG